MHQEIENYRVTLWKALRDIYNQYLTKGDELSYDAVKQILLREVDQDGIDVKFVMRASFKFDLDGNGTVSFTELGNFLLKRHCRELSLQKFHIRKQLDQGKSDHYLTLTDFQTVVHDAFAFLGVVVPNHILEYIFHGADKDCDGLITYSEFFQLTYSSFCLPIPSPPPKPCQRIKRQLKLRISIVSELRRMYELYIQGRKVQASGYEIEKLSLTITGELSVWEHNFFFTRMFKLDIKFIQFKAFATHFLSCLSELGLSRLQSYSNFDKRHLSLSDFTTLLSDTFRFVNLDKYKSNVLVAIYKKICIKGKLSYGQYLGAWVKQYICEFEYCSEEVYCQEDDEEKHPSPDCQPIRPTPLIPSIPSCFKFSNTALSKKVRSRTFELLVHYDSNRNGQLEEFEIKNALRCIFHASESQVRDVTRNAFQYDLDHDCRITFQEFTNFTVEHFFGIITVQRLHREKFFSRGWNYEMNACEFAHLIRISMKYLGIFVEQAVIDLLFREIDLDCDGWISYSLYYMFLQCYFGSHRSSLPICPLPHKDSTPCRSDEQKFRDKYKCLTPKERFCKMLYDQFGKVFGQYDSNRNGRFQRDEIRQILVRVFRLSNLRIRSIMCNYLTQGCVSLTLDQLISTFLTLFFAKIARERRARCNPSNQYQLSNLVESEFLEIIASGCYFIRFKPLLDDLKDIFRDLDIHCRGYITELQFVLFLKSALGCEVTPEPIPSPNPKPDNKCCSPLVKDMQKSFWRELEGEFCTMDKCHRGYITESELVEWFSTTLGFSCEQILFSFKFHRNFDPDGNCMITSDQFCSFVLNQSILVAQNTYNLCHAGKINTELDCQDFQIILDNALYFLVTYRRMSYHTEGIFKQLATKDVLSISAFGSWKFYCIGTKPQ